MENLDKYIFYDKPVPYKGLNIYPVTMEDYLDFHMYVNCFLMDKNSVPDVEVISMTYLGYIYHLSAMGNPVLYLLDQLLKMVLHLPQKDDKGENYISYVYDTHNHPVFFIDGQSYDSNDFEVMRNIICRQNLIKLVDDSIDKEIRDRMKRSEELRSKMNGFDSGTIEDEMMCLAIETGYHLDYIYSMTIRRFKKMMTRTDYVLHYKIFKLAESAGFATFKTKIKDWRVDLDKEDKFRNMVSLDEVEAKMAGLPV